MKSRYHIDSSQIPLHRLQTDLQTRKLIPSRMPLKDNLEENFMRLENEGLTTLENLISALKDKNAIPGLSRSTGISEEYLILLRREANSYFPNPVPLHKFPAIPPETIQRLSDLAIKNSKHLFERCSREDGFASLASDSRVSIEELNRLYGLADLARAYGVGPVFADLLYQGGVRSMKAFLDHTPQEIIDLYQELVGKRADFSISDLKFSQDLARILLEQT